MSKEHDEPEDLVAGAADDEGRDRDDWDGALASHAGDDSMAALRAFIRSVRGARGGNAGPSSMRAYMDRLQREILRDDAAPADDGGAEYSTDANWAASLLAALGGSPGANADPNAGGGNPGGGSGGGDRSHSRGGAGDARGGGNSGALNDAADALLAAARKLEQVADRLLRAPQIMVLQR
jgi:hypothetical protein